MKELMDTNTSPITQIDLRSLRSKIPFKDVCDSKEANKELMLLFERFINGNLYQHESLRKLYESNKQMGTVLDKGKQAVTIEKTLKQLSKEIADIKEKLKNQSMDSNEYAQLSQDLNKKRMERGIIDKEFDIARRKWKEEGSEYITIVNSTVKNYDNSGTKAKIRRIIATVLSISIALIVTILLEYFSDALKESFKQSYLHSIIIMSIFLHYIHLCSNHCTKHLTLYWIKIISLQV